MTQKRGANQGKKNRGGRRKTRRTFLLGPPTSGGGAHRARLHPTPTPVALARPPEQKGEKGGGGNSTQKKKRRRKKKSKTRLVSSRHPSPPSLSFHPLGVPPLGHAAVAGRGAHVQAAVLKPDAVQQEANEGT